MTTIPTMSTATSLISTITTALNLAPQSQEVLKAQAACRTLAAEVDALQERKRSGGVELMSAYSARPDNYLTLTEAARALEQGKRVYEMIGFQQDNWPWARVTDGKLTLGKRYAVDNREDDVSDELDGIIVYQVLGSWSFNKTEWVNIACAEAHRLKQWLAEHNDGTKIRKLVVVKETK